METGDVYKTGRNPRGIALIVYVSTYRNFGLLPTKIPKPLDGYQTNLEKLSTLFQDLQYKVEVITDPQLRVRIQCLYVFITQKKMIIWII